MSKKLGVCINKYKLIAFSLTVCLMQYASAAGPRSVIFMGDSFQRSCTTYYYQINNDGSKTAQAGCFRRDGSFNWWTGVYDCKKNVHNDNGQLVCAF